MTLGGLFNVRVVAKALLGDSAGALCWPCSSREPGFACDAASPDSPGMIVIVGPK